MEKETQDQPAASRGKYLRRLRIPRFARPKRKPAAAEGRDPSTGVSNVRAAGQNRPAKGSNPAHWMTLQRGVYVEKPANPLSGTSPATPLTFGEMLDQKLFVEASRLLISREDRLFSRGSEEPGTGALWPPPGTHGDSGGGEEEGGKEEEEEDEDDVLQKDLEALLVHVWMAIHSTFTSPSSTSPSSTSSSSPSSSSSQEDLQLLQSAVSVIHQQEAQDRCWKEQEKEEEERGGGGSDDGEGGTGAGGEGGVGGGGGDEGGARLPVWRPLGCLETHRKLLATMVESRLNRAPVDDGEASKLSSAAKRELCGVGRRLKEDLLVVARKVSHCYPEELGVPKLYANLYHHAFARRMTELAQSRLGIDECIYLLLWVNDYYPNEILKHEELQAVFASAELGPLVPQDELQRLEDQYLTHKEGQVGGWLGSVLAIEQKRWQRGPEKVDHYWFSPLAVDTLQVVNRVVSEARSILSDQTKVQRFTAQLQPFLTSYRKALEDFARRKHDNSPAVMKANLVCIQQFRSFLEKEEDFLSGDQKVGLESSVRALEDLGYSALTCPIHLEIKAHYRLLWSGSWLARAGWVLDGLLESLDRELYFFTDLNPACRELLLGRLHEEFLVEYVRRMMKGKVMMRSKEEQEEAATLLCDHSNKIQAFFSEQGSSRVELLHLLTRISELLRLQDRESLKLEVAAMATHYPDLR
ncbi:Tumor necrosis factor alpha-induced protein 2 [Merluccius polli]|uniref:Tumor necrosis factor alpha-induced protein 2 n=1 Tax=Merluccius polli TaxID=89951 RepID=A0AA47P120_MERPO|nr:Tumor necrosis factor alpha-induced protein 2 [Merluccius polli]